jgi:aminoglycoside phosphotransferase family enzyme/predicted kinase
MDITEAMLDARTYPHPVSLVRAIETHISLVFLTGIWAYKIKKPVKNPFLDYSTLDLRRKYCELELSINRRFAPHLYESVQPIYRCSDGFRLQGPGEIVEYCIRMREFSQANLLSQLLLDGKLAEEHMDQLAEELARCHLAAEPVAIDQPWSRFERIWSDAMDNFLALRQLLDASFLDQLDLLEAHSKSMLLALKDFFEARRTQGKVRACHGDLHLGNIVFFEERVQLFDAIEFNESFRWIDCMSDLAFVLMDLEDHGSRDLANLLLNAYMQHTGDWDGLRVLGSYKLYRALVRAKVAAMRLDQHRDEPDIAGHALAEVRGYLDYGLGLLKTRRPMLIVTHGLSGSGKTYGTRPLLRCAQAIRIRSDVERKRLAGLDDLHPKGSESPDGLYGSQSTQRTYQRLVEVAKSSLQAGFHVIVDAACLKKEQRELFFQLARELEVDYVLLPFSASASTLAERIDNRRIAGRDASDADRAVLERQIAEYVPLAESELRYCTSVDALIAKLR